MASVTLNGVRKSFGSTEVVHGVDIGVEDGEFCVLVGPSGCGKSTLLRMIAGLEEISGGRIAIGDRVVNGVAPKERDIAMVFQSYALYLVPIQHAYPAPLLRKGETPTRGAWLCRDTSVYRRSFR